MPYTIGIQPDGHVPARQIHTVLPCLIGKLVVLRASATQRKTICRAYRSQQEPSRYDILFCGESTARILGVNGRDFEAELQEISKFRAIFIEPNARLGLIGAAFAGLTAVLAIIGIRWAPPMSNDDWNLLLVATASIAAVCELLHIFRTSLPE